MSFTKIENADLTDKGVIGLPDTPGLSTAAMQSKFEETARDVIIPKFNGLVDELGDNTAAGSIGAQTPAGRTGSTVQTLINEISADADGALKDSFNKIESGGTTFTASGEDTFKINAGSNVTITALSSPDKGIQISATGGGSSTGDMLMSDYDNVGTVKSTGGIPAYVTSAISGKADIASLSTVATSGDYNDLTNQPTIPTKTSDLTNDSNFIADASYVHTDNNYDSTAKTIVDGATAAINAKSTVTWRQDITTGQQIAKITIDGTGIDVYAPTGGTPGTGAVDSVNSKTGVVVLDLGDMNDANFAGVAQNDAVVRNGSNQWINVPLPAVALSGSYGDLTGKPTIPTVVSSYSSVGTDAVNGTAVNAALQTLDVSDSAVSGQYVSAVSETDGKISVTRASLPTVPTNVSAFTNDSGYQTASDVSTAISGKEDKSALKDLAYIAKDGVGSTKVLQGDGTWVTPSSGGHTMIPTPSSSPSEATVVSTINGKKNTANDDSVVSAYSVSHWSNEKKIRKTMGSTGISSTGIGTWFDGDPSTIVPSTDEADWWYDDEFKIPDNADDVEVAFKFDPSTNEAIVMGGYILDTTTGKLCIKFGNTITNTTDAKVAVDITYTRNEVD